MARRKAPHICDASMRGFTVDADGSDLLIAHDSFAINQPTPALGLVTGAVVLIGMTSIDEVLLA